MIEFIVIAIFSFLFLFVINYKKTVKKRDTSKLNYLINKYPENIYIISDFKCDNNESPLDKCKKYNHRKVNNMINLESIDDMIRMITGQNEKEPLNIIIHTEGGESDVPDTLSSILNIRTGIVRIYIPSYAYSSGTMIALSADEIFMNWYSTCSPIDVQVDVSHDNELEESYSTKHVRNLRKCKPKDDRQYLQGCEAEDYHKECEELVRKVLVDNENVDEIIEKLVNHSVSHSKSFTRDELEELGLPIKRDVPIEVMEIFDEFKRIFIN